MNTNKRFKLIGGIVLLSIGLSSFAIDTQDNTSICVTKLKKAYIAEEESILKVINSGDCWTLDYTNHFVSWNPTVGKFEESNTSGKLMATQKMRYAKTNNIEVYMDENNTYTIDLGNKTIVHTKTDRVAFQKERPLFSTILHDSLFKEYKIVSCNEVNHKNATLIRYRIIPRIMRDATFSSIDVYIDPRTLFFKEIDAQMNMAKISSVKSYSLVMNSRGVKKIDKSWNNVKNHVVAADGTLVNKYKGFVLKDLLK